MVTGSNKPTNTNWNQIDLNNGGWIIIAILICIIVILIAITLFIYLKSQRKINELQMLADNNTSDEEQKLLTQYRKLNTHDKNIVIDTISTLHNSQQQNETLTKE